MSIFQLTTSSDDLSRSAPVCIIGAGIAGLLLARKLAQNGQRVIVLESGLGSQQEEPQQLNEIEDAGGRYRRALSGRYRALGGTSTRWGGRMIPISDHEIDTRSYLSLPGWPFPAADLAPYRTEIERLFGVVGGSYEDDLAGRNEPSGVFLRDDPDLATRWAKCPTFRRCNLATVLRKELASLKPLEIWLDATVCGFELDPVGGRLAAVSAKSLSGRTISVKADRFVLAAGTIESTRLLLWIDAASGGRAFAACDVLGRYFQDHLKAPVATISRQDPTLSNQIFGYRFARSTRRDLHWETTAAAQREDAVCSAFAYVTMNLDESPLGTLKRLAQGVQRRDIAFADVLRVSRQAPLVAQAAYWRLRRHQLFVPADVGFNLQVWIEQLPQWKNRIRLAATQDRLSMPKVLLEWAPTAADERTFRAANARIKAYWARSGLDQLCPLSWNEASLDPSMPIVDNAETCAHPSGSTRMGTDPKESVVDADLSCHAIPNVSVASASTFPTAGSANPTLTIMKLTLRLADTLLRQMQRPLAIGALGGADGVPAE